MHQRLVPQLVPQPVNNIAKASTFMIHCMGLLLDMCCPVACLILAGTSKVEPKCRCP